MKVESKIFKNNDRIPVEYTCHGKGTQIPIEVSDVPEKAKSLALIVDDPDAPNGNFVHWVVWNINPKISIIGDRIKSAEGGTNIVEGNTSLGHPGWVAPCPPSGVHHYVFKLFALDTLLSISEASTKADLLSAMEGHIIEDAMLVGLYGKEN